MSEKRKPKRKPVVIAGRSKNSAADSHRQNDCPARYDSPCRLENIALDTAIYAISFADIGGRVTYVNRAFLDLFGFEDKQEVLGRPTYEFFASKDFWVETRKRLLSEGKWVGETEIKRKDGSFVCTRVSSNLVKDETGHSLCTMASFIDITETMRTIEALRKSEHNFKMLFYGAAEGIIAADVKTKKFKIVNTAACKMLGYTEQELVRLSVADIHPKDFHKKISGYFGGMVRGRRMFAGNCPCLRKDGSIIYVDIHAEKILIDSEEYLVGFFVDITDRLRTEEELRNARDELEVRVQRRTEQLARANEDLRKEIAERKRAEKARAEVEKRFEDIFENALVGIYRTTSEGQILMANPALVKMLGYSSFEDLSRRNLEKTGFEPSYSRSVFKKTVERKGYITGLESVWLRHDGARITVRESSIAVRNEKGKVVYYEGTVENITERKKAEEKLLAYQKQLRSLALELALSEERMRRQMATDVHDNMGQNLAIIKIKMDSFRKTITEASVRRNVDEISSLLAETIERTRTLTFELSPPVLYELGFEAAVEWMVRHISKRDNLLYEFKDDRKPKPLEDNVKILLFQSVRELLVNIAKHSHAGKVMVAINRKDEEIQVHVADDGVGFDVLKVRDYERKSSGFGLFSVNERISSIGGRFEIESKPGGGTKVLLSAPLKKETRHS